MRNEIFPLLDSVFGQDWRNKMKQLGSQSNEWGIYIDQYIINPWLSQVKKGKAGLIIPIKDQPILIYSNVIMKSLHSISQSMLKKSSLDKINNLLLTKHNKIVTLDGKLKKLNSFNLAEEQSLSGTRICALIESNTKLIIIDTNLVKIKHDLKEDENYEEIINGFYNHNMKVQNNILKFLKSNI